MTSTQWQLAHRAAERYAGVLVPTILGPAARALVAWSTLHEGETVVDVGCGSGAATFAAAERVGRNGRIIAVDINPGMLAVARANALADDVRIEWHEQSAYALPLDEGSVDVVIAAQLFQFLDDRPRGAREMHRVLKPRGGLFISTWCGIALNPYFDALVEAIARELGAQTASGLNAAFSLPESDELRSLLLSARFTDVQVVAHRLDLTLPPPADFVPRHVAATPLAEVFADAPPGVRQAIARRVTDALSSYVQGPGFRVPFTLNLACGVR